MTHLINYPITLDLLGGRYTKGLEGLPELLSILLDMVMVLEAEWEKYLQTNEYERTE